MTFHTTEGLREIDTDRYCCDGACRLGGECPREDFLRQENALTAAIRWSVPAALLWLLIAAGVAGMCAAIGVALGYWSAT